MSTLAVTNLKHESATGNNIILDSSGNAAFADGSASAPSITNDGDTNTGIYFPAADNIGFATNGVIRGRWTTDGLCFNADTAAANALDDYEEGTWTATVTTVNENATFTSGQTATGRYTKIGRLITFHVSVVPNVSNVGTGALRISGLPFTNSGGYTAITNTHDTLSASTGQGYVYDSGLTMAFVNANSITELPISGTGQKYLMVAGLYFAT